MAAAMTTTAVLILLGACGGSPAATGSGSSPGPAAHSPSALGFSQCMRSHGLPDYPDPGSGGVVPKTSAQQLGVSESVFNAAERACQTLIPAAGGSAEQEEQQCFEAEDCSPAVVQQLMTVMRRFSRCMRSHGVPNFPDPSTDSQGQPYFDASAQGISDAESHSTEFTAKLDECQRIVGNFPFSIG
jgi:hypothetical protein